MTENDKMRCNSLLATLNFNGGAGMARVLRDELEHTHGVYVTLDRVRADLVWLAGIGAVQKNGDQVILTEDGRNHALMLQALF